jgi:hypothetical protein
MNSAKSSAIRIAAVAWALSGALAASFLACALVEILVPGLPLTHKWVELFTSRPISDPLAWIGGVAASVAFGWFNALIGVPIYNRLA